MVNSGLQLVGFSLSLIAWICSIVTTFLPYWRKSDIEGEVLESVRQNEGLWTKCKELSTGLRTCDDYDTIFLGLPASLQGARATACVSMILGLFGALICVLGLDCTSVASGNLKLKARMVMVSGILHMLAGISIGIAVSWFAANILYDYYYTPIALQRGTRFVYGEALFVGWVSMVLGIVSGLILCCSSWNVDDDDHRVSYAYNPPKPKPTAAEYI